MAEDATEEPAAAADPRSTLGTVRNATFVLGLLSEGPAYQPITELAERSGLSLATLHRLLRSLALAGLVEQHPESSRYGLGPEVLRLAARYLHRMPALRVLAPYLVELRNATGATIAVSVLVGGDLVRIDRLEGEATDIFREAHQIEDPTGTAAGRILLGRTASAGAAVNGHRAHSEDEHRAWGAAPHLAVTVGDQVEVAVPILDRRNRPVAALSARIPNATHSGAAEERLVGQLLRVAGTARMAIGDA